MTIHDDIAALKGEFDALTARELELWNAIIEAKRAELAKVKLLHQSVITTTPPAPAIPQGSALAPSPPQLSPTPAATAATPPATAIPAATPTAPPEDHHVPAPPAPVIPGPPQAAPAAPQGPAPGSPPPPPQVTFSPPPQMPVGNADAMDLIRQLTS